MIKDLVAWERGELSLEALSARHQETGIDGTVALHHMFEEMSREETAGPTATQVKGFLAGLPERVPRRGLLSALHLSGSQKVMAILSSLFLSGGVAYAAGFTPVREGVDSLVRGVASLLDRSGGGGGSKDPGHDPSDGRPGTTGTPGEDTTPGDDGDPEPTGADQDPSGNVGPDHGDDGGGGNDGSDDDRDEDVDDHGGLRDDDDDGDDDGTDDGDDDGGDDGVDGGGDDGVDGGDDGDDDGDDDGVDGGDEDADDDNSGEGDLDVDDDDPSVHLEGHL